MKKGIISLNLSTLGNILESIDLLEIYLRGSTKCLEVFNNLFIKTVKTIRLAILKSVSCCFDLIFCKRVRNELFDWFGELVM